MGGPTGKANEPSPTRFNCEARTVSVNENAYECRLRTHILVTFLVKNSSTPSSTRPMRPFCSPSWAAGAAAQTCKPDGAALTARR